MKLLSFATVTSVGRTRHLGALVSGDADSGEVIDLTAASRALLASEGLDELSKYVDSLIVIPNEKLMEVLGEDVPFRFLNVEKKGLFQRIFGG